jgi:Lipocalin-like domain
MKKTILSLLVVSSILFGCKKDDKNDTCELSSASIVGTYKLTALTYKASASATPVDEYASFAACEKDDLTIFNANNTVTFSDAGVACVPNGNDTGVWTLSANQLTVDGDVSTVTSFSCSGMTITFTSSVVVGDITTATFVKQ